MDVLVTAVVSALDIDPVCPADARRRFMIVVDESVSMAVDVDIPYPPDLTNRGTPSSLDTESLDSPSDLRREELEGLLRDGAWRESFAE